MSTSARRLLLAFLSFARECSGCAAGGVRLRSGQGFPYWQTAGFPSFFAAAENPRCGFSDGRVTVGDAGEIPTCRCICGVVLRRECDPGLSYCTAHGSFWSNSLSELLTAVFDQEDGIWVRNRCTQAGYESMALIPLARGNAVVGILQLNDRAKNKFTPELLSFLEEAARRVAEQLASLPREAAVGVDFRCPAPASDREDPVGALAAGVAHNLNNLLTPVLGYSQLLMDTMEPGSDARRQVAQIHRAAERSRSFVQQLLVYGQRESLLTESTDPLS